MISCICLTYGRTWLRQEAIQSFIEQENRVSATELIIVNDMPDQFIRVKPVGKWPIIVYNCKKRFDSLNDKFDYAVSLALYDYVCFWDDDDISLPHRLGKSYSEVATWPNDYIAFNTHFYCNNGNPTICDRGIHGGDVFPKRLYFSLGGSQGVGHNDENFVAKCRQVGRYRVADNHKNPFYLYRWAGITAHNSAYASGPDSLQTCAQMFHSEVVADKRFKKGVIDITPCYTQQTQQLIERTKIK